MITIQFCGGAKSVTGANYLINTGRYKFLIDCGLAQGSYEADKSNYEEFVYDPSQVDFLIVTHAHTDHIGRVPKLVKDGFGGTIYSTLPTKDFAAVSLMDTVSVMEAEHEQLPLYGESEVEQSMKLWQGQEYGITYTPNEDISFRFQDAGHILGSAIVEIWINDRDQGRKIKLVASGDLGNWPSVLLRKYEYIEDADYVLIESAYGDRLHEDVASRKEILRQAIKDTITRKSILLMPTFSIERTQDILYELNDIVENHSGDGKVLGRVGKIDVYLDSPLGVKATEIHGKYPQYYNSEAKKLAHHDNVFKFPFFRICETREDSMMINTAPNPKLIMAGSGMSTGGRILHHEARYLSNANNIILFVGYQAPNTLGRSILEGRNTVTIRGKEVSNRIEVRQVGGYSAHADQDMLVDWVSKIKGVKNVYVVQGEEKASKNLAQLIQQKTGMQSTVPDHNQIIQLT